VGADGGGVEDQQVQLGLAQRRQDRVPEALGGPAVEPPPGAVPGAEPRRQVGPGDAGAGDVQGRAEGQPVASVDAKKKELVGGEIGNRAVLVKDEYWIGAGPSCAIARADYPFCESRHARLFRNARGGWSVEHDKSLNGLWLRMPQIAVESVVHFQAGEQRFRIRVP
jgi:hypothetical protein